MDVKTLSNMFRMNVREMAILTGYSRQNLYNLTKLHSKHSKTRVSDFLIKMSTQNEMLYQQDIAIAKEQYQKRTQALKEFSKQIQYNKS